MSFSIEELMGLMEAEGDDATVSRQRNDDFSIDTSLDNDNQDQQQTPQGDAEGQDGEEEAQQGQEGAPEEDGAPELPQEDNGESEPNEDNTDLFFTLSKEEQTMKIKLLKTQYGKLYESCDELISRIDDLNTDESNVLTINRLSESIYNLKKYLSDYFIHLFPSKSFIENDIMFNRFLDIINTITVSFDKIAADIKRKNEEKEKNHDQ